MRRQRPAAFLGALPLTATAALVLALSGCGGGGSGDGGGGGIDVTPATLIGLWRNIRISAGGQSANCPGELVDQNDQAIRLCGEDDTIEFRANGDLEALGLSEDSVLESSSRVRQATRHPGNPHETRIRGNWQITGTRLDLFIEDVSVDENDNGIFESRETTTIDEQVEGAYEVRLPSASRMVIRYSDGETNRRHEDTYEKL